MNCRNSRIRMVIIKFLLLDSLDISHGRLAFVWSIDVLIFITLAGELGLVVLRVSSHGFKFLKLFTKRWISRGKIIKIDANFL